MKKANEKQITFFIQQEKLQPFVTRLKQVSCYPQQHQDRHYVSTWDSLLKKSQMDWKLPTFNEPLSDDGSQHTEVYGETTDKELSFGNLHYLLLIQYNHDHESVGKGSVTYSWFSYQWRNKGGASGARTPGTKITGAQKGRVERLSQIRSRISLPTKPDKKAAGREEEELSRTSVSAVQSTGFMGH